MVGRLPDAEGEATPRESRAAMTNLGVQNCDVLFLIRFLGRGGAERQLSLLPDAGEENRKR